MMKISIIEGHHQPESRTTQKGVMWSQKAYVELGGAYPAPMKLSLQSPNEAYRPGDYELSPECFRVGQYGDLEINRFAMKLMPLQATSTARANATTNK